MVTECPCHSQATSDEDRNDLPIVAIGIHSMLHMKKSSRLFLPSGEQTPGLATKPWDDSVKWGLLKLGT